jgi:hypothetical protein
MKEKKQLPREIFHRLQAMVLSHFFFIFKDFWAWQCFLIHKNCMKEADHKWGREEEVLS